MLTVEDGTIVPGANSYVTLATADAYLAPFGGEWLTLTNPEKEQRLAQGFLIVDDAATYQYTGQQQDALQEALWPRVNAKRYRGQAVPLSTIPYEVQRAQMTAASGLAEGYIVWGASVSERAVKSESVEGVGSFSYFEAGKSVAQPTPIGPFAGVGWPQVTAILAPLLDRGSYTAVPNAGLSGFVQPSYKGLWDVGMQDGPGSHRDAPGAEPGGHSPDELLSPAP